MDPVTIAIIAAAATATARGVAAYGQYQAGKAEEKAQKYNAQVQQQQADAERKAAAYEARQISEEGRRLEARQRVLFAQSGVDMAGTPLLVLQDTARQVQQDIQMSVYGGGRRGEYYQQGANLSLMRGRSAKQAGKIDAFGSLLGAAGESAYQYYSMKPK